MNFYDDLVMQTQMNYSKYHPIYASGSTPYQTTGCHGSGFPVLLVLPEQRLS